MTFRATLQLIETARQLVLETAQLRFKTNFGTAICDRCDGLHAGPGVTATCFQVKQCNYSNIVESEGTTTRQRRVLGILLGDKK